MITIDLSQDGKQTGCLYAPHSTDRSGAGRIEVPVVSIRNGDGPRVLCMAGVHGDEFEGQILWTDLIRRVGPEQVRGQLIVVPCANTPSAVAGSRVSPLDEGNLNRLFPGDPHGGPTARIAHAIETLLISQADVLIDLHGGGNSSLFLSGPTVTRTQDATEMAALLELLEVFGASRGYVFAESGGGAGGTLGACRRHGVRRLGTEIGGGGMVRPADLEMMRAGVLRVLIHLGVLDPALGADLPPPHKPEIHLRGNAASPSYVFAPEDGLFAPEVELGDRVDPGRCLGQLLWPELPHREPVPVHAQTAGLVICRRRPGRALRGDNLFMLGVPYDGR